MINKLIGQLLIIGISGPELTSEEKKFIVENNIGGVILFDRNIKNPKQLFNLCIEIQNLAKQTEDKTPLYISIDMEGGRVLRLKDPFTKWPATKYLGLKDSATLSFNFAYHMGLELNAVGINLNFAPSVDVLTNPENKVIGDRSISSDPQLVAKHASALVRGYLKAGVIPCIKHFPGHGNTLLDSHEHLPIEHLNLERLESIELIPFKKSIKSHADMIMTSHILFEKIDPKWPVTLSKYFLQDLLRIKYGFKGLIITDDLGMKALSNQYTPGQISVRALNAGANILLFCNEPKSPVLALEAIRSAITEDTLKNETLEISYKKILDHKKKHLNNISILTNDESSQQERLSLIGCKEHSDIASELLI